MTYLFFSRFFLAAAFFLLTLPNVLATSRLAHADWKEGVVILTNQEVLRGEVYYDYTHDLVLLRAGDRQPVTTLTARQVQSLRYYDPQDDIIHDFVVIDQHPRLPYSVRTFYEVVTTGEVLYLRKRNRCPLRPPAHENIHTVAYNYFAYHAGTLVRAHHFDKELLPRLTQDDPSLARYIDDNRLRAYDVGDQIRVIEYFNRPRSQPIAHLVSSE